jgi:hypothetical protein
MVDRFGSAVLVKNEHCAVCESGCIASALNKIPCSLRKYTQDGETC